MIARIVTSIRRNAIAWLALFVALTGTSMAASHYVVSSTKQIKPSVLKKLKGNRGPAGAQGPQGPQGASGKEGVGSQGVRGPTGPSGTTGTKGTNGATGPEGPTGPGVGATGERGATGATGATGKEGATGAAGTNGSTGATGAGGGVGAFAHITAAGAVESPSASFETAKVVAEPKNPKTGIKEKGVYCISGLSFTPKNVQASLAGEEAEFALTPLVHLGPTEESGCSVSTQITVETFEVELVPKKEEVIEEPANMGFFILIN